MTTFYFPCRVFAATYNQAQELIIAMMLKRDLKPMEKPRPKRLTITNDTGEYWWECYAKCNVL